MLFLVYETNYPKPVLPYRAAGGLYQQTRPCRTPPASVQYLEIPGFW